MARPRRHRRLGGGPLDAAAVVHQLRVAVWATGTASADGLTPGHLRAM